MLNPKTDIVQLMINDIDELMKKLRLFLNELGYDSGRMSMEQLIDAVLDLKVMVNDSTYAGIIKDQNGYVAKIIPIHDFVKMGSVPSDGDGGYYKLEKDLFVLDDERKRQLEV